MKQLYRLPLFEDFNRKKIMLESLEDEGIENVSMVDVVLSLKDKGYGNDKILKIKNLLDTDEKSNVAIEDLVDAFINLGVDQNTVGDLMSDISGDKEKGRTIYVVKDNNFYKYTFREWKSMVDAVIRDESLFDPEQHKKPVDKPKHIYKGSDEIYYSSLPNVTIYDTKDWNLENFKELKQNGYK